MGYARRWCYQQRCWNAVDIASGVALQTCTDLYQIPTLTVEPTSAIASGSVAARQSGSAWQHRHLQSSIPAWKTPRFTTRVVLQQLSIGRGKTPRPRRPPETLPRSSACKSSSNNHQMMRVGNGWQTFSLCSQFWLVLNWTTTSLDSSALNWATTSLAWRSAGPRCLWHLAWGVEGEERVGSLWDLVSTNSGTHWRVDALALLQGYFLNFQP
jgi:hypothetical protein